MRQGRDGPSGKRQRLDLCAENDFNLDLVVVCIHCDNKLVTPDANFCVYCEGKQQCTPPPSPEELTCTGCKVSQRAMVGVKCCYRCGSRSLLSSKADESDFGRDSGSGIGLGGSSSSSSSSS